MTFKELWMEVKWKKIVASVVDNAIIPMAEKYAASTVTPLDDAGVQAIKLLKAQLLDED